MNTTVALWVAVGLGGALVLLGIGIAALQVIPPSGSVDIDTYRYEQGQSSMLGLFQPSVQLIGGAID